MMLYKIKNRAVVALKACSLSSLVLLTSCGGGSASPSGIEAPQPLVQPMNMAAFAASNAKHLLRNSSADVTASYLPIISNSTKSLTISDPSFPTNTPFAVSLGSCGVLESGTSCAFVVTFDSSSTYFKGLASTSEVLSYKVSDGSDTYTYQIPVKYDIFDSTKLVLSAATITLVPETARNASTNYYDSGVLTLYNNTESTYKINTSAISFGGFDASTKYNFTSYCNESASSDVLSANSSCSIAYTLKVVTKGIIPNTAQITVPLLDNSDNSLTLLQTGAPVVKAKQSQPLLDNGNSIVSLVSAIGESSVDKLALINLGNGKVSKLALSNLPNGVTASGSESCVNLASGSVCEITLSKESSAKSENFDLNISYGGSASLIIPVAMQDLSLQPTGYNFGSNLNGSEIIFPITITNDSNESSLEYKIPQQNGTFTLEPGFCNAVSSNGKLVGILPKHSSCLLQLVYSVSYSGGESDIASIPVTGKVGGQNQVTIFEVSGSATASSYTNLVGSDSISGYTDVGAHSLAVALGGSDDGGVYMSNSQNAIWRLSPPSGGGLSTWSNISTNSFNSDAEPLAIAAVPYELDASFLTNVISLNKNGVMQASEQVSSGGFLSSIICSLIDEGPLCLSTELPFGTYSPNIAKSDDAGTVLFMGLTNNDPQTPPDGSLLIAFKSKTGATYTTMDMHLESLNMAVPVNATKVSAGELASSSGFISYSYAAFVPTTDGSLYRVDANADGAYRVNSAISLTDCKFATGEYITASGFSLVENINGEENRVYVGTNLGNVCKGTIARVGSQSSLYTWVSLGNVGTNQPITDLAIDNSAPQTITASYDATVYAGTANASNPASGYLFVYGPNTSSKWIQDSSYSGTSGISSMVFGKHKLFTGVEADGLFFTTYAGQIWYHNSINAGS